MRIRLQLASRIRDLSLFNLAIDSKLRACDLVKLRVRDLCYGERVSARATVMLRTGACRARLTAGSGLVTVDVSQRGWPVSRKLRGRLYRAGCGQERSLKVMEPGTDCCACSEATHSQGEVGPRSHRAWQIFTEQWAIDRQTHRQYSGG